MLASSADRIDELRSERLVLKKAVADIAEGWKRIQHQEELVSELRAAGHDTRQAERLTVVFKDTLAEWERHCDLIKNRISYLEKNALGS